MKQLLFVVLIGSFLFFACNGPEKTPVVNAPLHTTEGDAIKKAVDDAYRAIGFKKRQDINFTDIKKPFIPQAHFISFSNDSLGVLTLDQFVDYYKSYIEANNVSAFFEEEISGTTDQFGKVAQRISSYRTFLNSADTAAQRGVNSFQLVKTPEGWRVSSIIWDIETPN